MRKLIYLLILFFIALCIPTFSSHAQWSKSPLVTINEQEFSSEDFEKWWKYWKEEGDSFPDNLGEFIEWQLMAEQAKSMELDSTPGYVRKVGIFLKMRSLLLLRDEEVVSKIHIDEKEIQHLYNTEYLPIWSVHILYYRNKNEAETAQKDITSGNKSFADVSKTVDPHKDNIRYAERIFRPVAVSKKPEWLASLTKLDRDGITPVIKEGDWFAIGRLEDITEPPENDYDQVKNLLENNIFKIKQQELQQELIEKLKIKYKVKIDEEVAVRLEEGTLPEEWLDRPVVTTDRSAYAAKNISQLLAREEKLRKQNPLTAEKKKAMARNFIESIIADAVQGYESIERHYEEREPLKPEFEFYKKNRLNIALKKWLFAQMEEIDDGQLTAYYEKNIQSFTSPEMVHLGLVTTDQKTAKKIWLATLKGREFFNVVEKDLGLEIKIQKLFYDNLAPELQQEIAGLADGDVSSPVEADGNTYIFKLFEHKKKQAAPLDRVEEAIRKQLADEKFIKVRAEYIRNLKKASSISVNQQEWEAIQKKHRGKNET